MKRQNLALCAWCALVLCTSPATAGVLETWESQAQTDPFNGIGDLIWVGDRSQWAITTATWPTLPAQDFAGVRSLRSTNHPSAVATEVSTVTTNITSSVDFTLPMEWSVFFSGNSISIQPSRRADFILLSDKFSGTLNEDPDGTVNGYKLTLNDPFAGMGDNFPPGSHEGAALADSLTLWRVAAPDERWRVIGSIPLGATDDVRDGWNIRARRDPDGTWSIGFANGAIGQTPALTSLGIDAGAPPLSAFTSAAFAGVGWSAPTTSGDSTDFGFDNFSVQAVPEPSSIVLIIGGLFGVFGLANRRSEVRIR